jgi:hypothetical protein
VKGKEERKNTDLGQLGGFAQRGHLLGGVDAEGPAAAVRLDGLVGMSRRPGEEVEEAIPGCAYDERRDLKIEKNINARTGG